MSVKFQLTKVAALVATLVSTAALAPLSASAQDRPVTIYGEAVNARTELVSFARLNLADAGDQRRLKHRVGAAVERVCLREIGRDGLQDRAYYACEDQAWSEAAPANRRRRCLGRRIWRWVVALRSLQPPFGSVRVSLGGRRSPRPIEGAGIDDHPPSANGLRQA